MQDAVHPRDGEVHVRVREQQREDDERDRQVDDGAAAQQVHARGSRRSPPSRTDEQQGRTDQVAQDREVAEVVDQIELAVVGEGLELDPDRDERQQPEDEPKEGEEAASGHQSAVTRPAMARRWSGVLPQHPPMIVAPASRIASAWTAIAAGSDL